MGLFRGERLNQEQRNQLQEGDKIVIEGIRAVVTVPSQDNGPWGRTLPVVRRYMYFNGSNATLEGTLDSDEVSVRRPGILSNLFMSYPKIED